MEDWEVNLQRVDKILFNWMKEKGISTTTPPQCIDILEKNGPYNATNRLGSPLRYDLREARKSAGIKDSEAFTYFTEHLKFEQKAKRGNWFICRVLD